MAGGNMREIKHRIKSVKNTHKITKAMEMVSSSKFKKFNNLVANSRPYSESLNNILKSIAGGIKSEHHPLFEGREKVKKVGLIVIASDRGLCGGFNSNTTKLVEKYKLENPDKEISIIAVGKKVRDYCRKREYDMKAEYIQLIPETLFEKAKEISENVVDFFYENIFDEVHIIYTEFISAIATELRIKQLIPVERIESEENQSYIFEPSEEIILDSLLPKYLNIYVYQSLLESMASEHSSRMRAMKSASDNAEEMIDDLTLSYNRARQATITQEIAEIAGGAEALK
ncbi:MAG: ATP synthase F1 subunit gamma [Fusobacteriia bacterium 4572_132]|nr:MAG: ATP synthase F1 subunit gamma [Fusobacteriia bacterium 4572_132]